MKNGKSSGGGMHIAFIGFGNMAEAMLARFIEAGIADPDCISVSDIDAGRRSLARRRFRVAAHRNNAPCVEDATVVFLAVKPKAFHEVLEELAPVVHGKHLIISIAAGIKLARIEAVLGRARVVRAMPNIACLVSEAMSVYALGARTTSADKKTVERLFGEIGRVLELPESKFDSVTALSGSGPGFIAYVLEAVVQGAMSQGVNRKHAEILVAQALVGTGRLLLETDMSPKALVARVATPGGTTAAGIKALEKGGATAAFRKAVASAAKRSKELSQETGNA